MPNFCTQCGKPIGVLQSAPDAMREIMIEQIIMRLEGHSFSLRASDHHRNVATGIVDSVLSSAPVPSPDGAAGELPLAVRLRDEEGPPLPQMAAQRRVQLANAAAAPPPPDDVRSALADRLSKLSVCLDYRTPHPHTRFVAGLAMSEDDRDLIVAALRLASVSVPATTMRDALVEARPYVEIVYTGSQHVYDKAVLEQIDNALRTSTPAVGVTREAMTAAVRHEIERCTEGLLYIPRPLDERIVDAIRSLESKATS